MKEKKKHGSENLLDHMHTFRTTVGTLKSTEKGVCVENCSTNFSQSPPSPPQKKKKTTTTLVHQTYSCTCTYSLFVHMCRFRTTVTALRGTETGVDDVPRRYASHVTRASSSSTRNRTNRKAHPVGYSPRSLTINVDVQVLTQASQ